MPKIDIDSVEQSGRTGYPPPYDADVAGRSNRKIGLAAGLTEIGVTQCVLQPGAWSSQRHWHEGIDEFVVVIDGEATLVEDDGETILRAGDCAAFPRDVANGHHLVNRSDRPCTFLAIDNRRGEGDAYYPDIDLRWESARGGYSHSDGTPY